MQRAYQNGAGHIICQNGVRHYDNPIELNTTTNEMGFVAIQ